MIKAFRYTRDFLRGFRRDEDGATAIEYGILVALIAIALMIGIGAVYDAMDVMFANVGDAVKEQDPG